MAITILTPGAVPFEDFRKKLADRNRWKVRQRIVDLAQGKVQTAEGVHEDAHPHALVYFLSSLFLASLVILLFINTALTQDAFVLEHLKQKNNIVKDQRDAILRQAAAKSSPSYVAAKAIALGMIPSEQPEFIALEPATSERHG